MISNNHKTPVGRGHGELTVCACRIVLRCVHGIHGGIDEVGGKDSILGRRGMEVQVEPTLALSSAVSLPLD